MASVICDNCGTKNFENAKNCRSCLQVLGLKEITRKSDESIFLQTEFNKQPEETDYQIPEDYVETTSYGQRVKLLIWDRDYHTIKELTRRSDLQSEAMYGLFIVASLMSIITIIDWTLNQDLNVSYPVLVFGAFVLIFANTYIFVFIFVFLGRMLTGTSFTMDRNNVFRPISYAYAIRVIETFVSLIANTTQDGNVSFFWFVLVIYELLVFMSIFTRLFDSRAFLGFITVVLAFLIAFNLSQLVIIVFFNLLDFVF